MTTHISEFVTPQQVTAVQLASSSNIAGIYAPGKSYNGVGDTLTTASSTLTIDSVAVVNGNSVLLADQTSSFQNGIYVVSGVGTAVVLTRRADFQCAMQIIPGYYIPITTGAIYGGTLSQVAAPGPVIVGVSPIVITGAVIPAAPTTLTLGNGGLNVYNPAETFLNQIVPTSNTTADRQFSLITGDQATTLDLSGAVNFAPTVFGGTLSTEATKLTAQVDLGFKYGSSGPMNVTSPNGNLFTAANVLGTDIVVVVLASCTTPAYIVGYVPIPGSINVNFNVAPGANTIIHYYAIPTI